MLCHAGIEGILAAIDPDKAPLEFKVKLGIKQAEALGVNQDSPAKVHTFNIEIDHLHWNDQARTSCQLQGMLLPREGHLCFRISFTCRYEVSTNAGTINIHYN